MVKACMKNIPIICTVKKSLGMQDMRKNVRVYHEEYTEKVLVIMEHF
jgi:hypothetical protein